MATTFELPADYFGDDDSPAPAPETRVSIEQEPEIEIPTTWTKETIYRPDAWPGWVHMPPKLTWSDLRELRDGAAGAPMDGSTPAPTPTKWSARMIGSRWQLLSHPRSMPRPQSRLVAGSSPALSVRASVLITPFIVAPPLAWRSSCPRRPASAVAFSRSGVTGEMIVLSPSVSAKRTLKI